MPLTLRPESMPKPVGLLLVLLLAFPAAGDLLVSTGAPPGLHDGTFLPVEQAFRPEVLLDAGVVVVRWHIEPGYYLYRHQLGFALNLPHGEPEIPAGEPRHDEYFGDVEVYFDELVVSVPLELADAVPARLSLRYQGCAVAGLCYPPQTQVFELVGPSETPNKADIFVKNPLESAELPGK